MMDAKVWIVCSVGILYLSVCDGGYCTQYYSNSETCSHLVHYLTSCGWWSKCGRYRSTSYVCIKQRSRRMCCTGYQGQDCSQPICFGSTSCPNGGTCKAPNTCSCRAGFSGKKCSDDDECTDKTHSCDHNCINEEGAYSCSCNMGYLLDINNRTCSDINECGIDTHECAQICTNENGTYICSCRPGYILDTDGRRCVDINECDMFTHECDQICSNIIGSYNCSCKPGYILHIDERRCVDINECDLYTHECDQICSNINGSYNCSCKPGYILHIDERRCVDIDECSAGSRICNHICTNLYGTYTCSCRSGYTLNTDNQTCSEEVNPTSMVWIVSISSSGAIVAVCMAVVVFLAIRRYHSKAETRMKNDVSYNKETVYFECLGKTKDQTCANQENVYNSLSGDAEYCYALERCQDDQKVSTVNAKENPMYINTI